MRVGRAMGKGVSAVLTDMSRPLGRTAGNAVEVVEALDALAGRGPDDLMEVTLSLGAEALRLAGLQADESTARGLLQAQIDGGSALKRFKEMVEAQGGDRRALDDPERLPIAPAQIDIPAPKAGYIVDVDAECIGRACILLGAGRSKTDDRVDPSAGISCIRQVGEEIDAGAPLAHLHASADGLLRAAKDIVAQAFIIADERPDIPKAVLERVAVTDSIVGESHG